MVSLDNQILKTCRPRPLYFNAIGVVWKVSSSIYLRAIADLLNASSEDANISFEIVESEVHFRQLNGDECLRYWKTGEPIDKAGGYAIQGLGATFIEKLLEVIQTL